MKLAVTQVISCTLFVLSVNSTCSQHLHTELCDTFWHNTDTAAAFQIVKIMKLETNEDTFLTPTTVVLFLLVHGKLIQLKIFRNFGMSISRSLLLFIFCGRLVTFMIASWASSNSFSPISFFTRSLQAISLGRPSNTSRPVPTGCEKHTALFAILESRSPLESLNMQTGRIYRERWNFIPVYYIIVLL